MTAAPALIFLTLLLAFLGSGALCSSIYGPPVQPQTDEGIANGLSAKSAAGGSVILGPGVRHGPFSPREGPNGPQKHPFLHVTEVGLLNMAPRSP